MNSLGSVCESVAASMRDTVRVETGELGQQGERRTTSAAGSQWPAWSSAEPVTLTHIVYYDFIPFYLCSTINMKI